MPRPAMTHPVAFPDPCFRPLTGAVELAAAEAVGGPGTRPERVTALLAAVCETVAGEPASPDMLRRVSAAGREWLLQRAALCFRPQLDWFEGDCTACGAPFDVTLPLRAAPQRAPGPGFPVAVAETSLGLRRFEVPNGAHEEAYARRGGDPARAFAALCGLADDAAAEAERFDAADLAAVDAALDATAAEIADSVATTCPECDAVGSARIEPLGFGFPDALAVLADAHLLARTYHWGEPTILAMPRQRRRAYAGLCAAEAPRWRAGRHA